MLHTIKNVAYNKKCCIQKKIWIKMLYTIKNIEELVVTGVVFLLLDTSLIFFWGALLV